MDFQPFDRIEHTADLAVRVRGRTEQELFRHAAEALFSLMCDLPSSETVERIVELESVDLEALLVDWLNELIFLNEVEGETFTRFEFEDFSPERLQAHVFGAPTVRKFKSIKAATFHDLHFEWRDGLLESTVVFDV